MVHKTAGWAVWATLGDCKVPRRMRRKAIHADVCRHEVRRALREEYNVRHLVKNFKFFV